LHNAHRASFFVPIWLNGFGVSLTSMHLIYLLI
jgi:hypothetical protein